MKQDHMINSLPNITPAKHRHLRDPVAGLLLATKNEKAVATRYATNEPLKRGSLPPAPTPACGAEVGTDVFSIRRWDGEDPIGRLNEVGGGRYILLFPVTRDERWLSILGVRGDSGLWFERIKSGRTVPDDELVAELMVSLQYDVNPTW